MFRQRRLILLVLASGILLVLVGLIVFLYPRGGRDTLPSQYYNATHASSSQVTSTTNDISHIMIIMEENRPLTNIVSSPSAPYINTLIHEGSLANKYYAVTDPSLPNYLAITSGTSAGITSDCNPPSSSCQAPVTNIADGIERAGRTWKEYAEGMPTPCDLYNSGEYVVKHNPFMYYPDITTNAIRCTSHVLPFTSFSSDLASETSLPSYAFITPDLCDDMHDCSVETGNNWLSNQATAILQSPAFTKQNSLLIIAWDEGESTNNNVPVTFVGPAAKKGFISENYYSHYSLLHTIENVWGLAPLTANDRVAPLMNDMLR